MTILTMIQSVRCVNSKRTKEAISCSICGTVQRNRIRLGTPVWVCTNLPGLIQSFAETGEDLHLHFDSAKRVAEAAVESAIARFQRTGSARRWDGTLFTTWSTPSIGNLAKVDRKRAERINQELQKKLCQTFQTEAAIDLACDQDQVLREHFPQAARSHREEMLPLIWKNLRTETSGSRGRRGRRNRDSTNFVRAGKAEALPTTS